MPRLKLLRGTVPLVDAQRTLFHQRFWHGVKILSNGCWEWQRFRYRQGYGQFTLYGFKTRYAHRIAYEILRDKVPVGLELDHLCRYTSCVNPWHLEPVTRRENLRRGFGPSGINARKTHCKHGHEFNEKNTYIDKTNSRHCRRCLSIRTSKEYMLMKGWKYGREKKRGRSSSRP